MIRYLSVGLVLIIAMMAIISRKNYSKYKDGADILWCLSAMMFHITPAYFKSKARSVIRKTSVLNTRSLEDKLSDFMIGLYHTFLVGMVIILIITIGITFIPDSESDLYTVKRPGVGENSRYVDMQLDDETDGHGERFSLEISPKEYTDEEFQNASAQAKSYIDSCFLGDNISDEKITNKLNLPVRDEEGVLKISWSTSEPNVISTGGDVSNDVIEAPTEVTLTAEIKDDNHTDTYTRNVVVVKDDNLTSSEKAKASILFIERDSRTDKELVIPREIDGVRVIRNSGREKRIGAFLFIGIIAILLFTYRQVNHLNEEGEKRDKQLENSYYSFVNRLAIHIGAGLSLRDAMRCAVKAEKSEYLKKEVGFTLNKVTSGVKENTAYMELGKNLGSQEYMRLMSLLSQNLAYGNTNLIGLLDSEVRQSFYIKREQIKKRGEEASEKLLMPTSILLILVIVIVMYPAFINL